MNEQQTIIAYFLMDAEHSLREAAADIPAEVCERYESLSRRHVSELFTYHEPTTAKEDIMADIEPNRLQNLHRYWCAANYLTIGQIYLQARIVARRARSSPLTITWRRTAG